MRIINELIFGDCKATLMIWNNRYIIKLERGLLEQTFKISQFDVDSEHQVQLMLNDRFIELANLRFDQMERDLQQALHEARAAGE
ncbi:MAG: hypothetical protein N2044_03265 [Cyclobacteriaceae bacterium]|nr:hypothetical protein [Cyclobacteriaceae bacterium]MCX7636845.1 hypothetical protein [Cyclobacteriaceae bacterium]MDW8330269.1 hypothetical protein [Cyclobacteriaceae bacterium]